MNAGQLSGRQGRARLAHEKEARRQAILASALMLFESKGYEALTIASIAADCGLAKGTIYIYFNTKEEIFLELAESMLLGWFEAMDEGLRRGTGLFPEPMMLAALSNLVLDSLAAQPQLARLLGILHTVLERNVDRLVAMGFKEFLADRCLRTGRLLEQRLPFLKEGEGAVLLLRVHALILGFWQMSDPPPQVKALLQAPGLQMFDLPFRPLFETTFIALLEGLEAQHRRQP